MSYQKLKKLLNDAEDLLSPGARLVVICFHSLEDKIVKNFIKTRSGLTPNPHRHSAKIYSNINKDIPSFKSITKKVVIADKKEIQINSRSRSAKLRAAEKLNKMRECGMMRIFVAFIIIFSVSGTVWSMWLSSEIKNENTKLKIINTKIINIEEKIRLVDAEWSFITSAKNLEYLNNKYLKLKAIPIIDISFIAPKKIVLSNKVDKLQKKIKEIN